MAKTIVAGVAGLVLGIALGMGAGMFSTSAPAVAEAESTSDPRNRVESSEAPGDRAIEVPRVAEESHAAQPDSDTSSARSVVTSEASPAPAGDGAINGRVTDIDGKGLPGVAVRASAESDREEASPSRRGKGLEPVRTLEEELANARTNYFKRTRGIVETLTDENGQYVLKGVSPGNSVISAARDGYVLEPQGSNWVRAGGTVDFTATGVALLPVEVLLPNGSAATRVNLTIQSNRSGSTELWTRESPGVVTKPGSCKLRAELVAAQLSANGVADEAASQWQSVDVPADHAEKVTLKLETRSGIRGRLLPHPELAMSQSIPIQRIALAAGADYDPTKSKDGETATSWASPNSKFEFLDLKPGRYAIVAASRYGSGSALVYEVVEVAAGITNLTLDLSKADTSKFILATVSDTAGRLVRDVNFSAMLKDSNNSSSGGDLLWGMSRRDGKYWLSPSNEAADFLAGRRANATLDLTVSTEATGPKTVPVAPGTKTLDIKFGKPASLDVTVSNYVGSGFEGRINVSLRRDKDSRSYGASGGMFGKGNVATADQGKFKIGPVEPGEYTLRMSGSTKNSDYYENLTLVEQPIALAEGTNQTTLAIPQLARLTVTVAGVKEGSIQLDNLSKSGRRGGELANGQAVIDGLLAGEYRVTYNDGNLIAEATIHVPDTANVELRPFEPNAIAIEIKDAKGELAKAGFQDGDLIVGIGGKAFAPGEAGEAFGSLGKVKKTVLVLRDGKSIEIEFSANKALRNGKSSGGGLRLAAH